MQQALELGLDAIGDRTRALGQRLREELSQIPGVTTHDLGTRRCAIVTAKIAGHSADDVAAALGRASINVSTTAAAHNPFDTEERGVHPLVRFSPHYYNTEAEIDRAVAAVTELAAGISPGAAYPAEAVPGSAASSLMRGSAFSYRYLRSSRSSE